MKQGHCSLTTVAFQSLYGVDIAPCPNDFVGPLSTKGPFTIGSSQQFILLDDQCLPVTYE